MGELGEFCYFDIPEMGALGYDAIGLGEVRYLSEGEAAKAEEKRLLQARRAIAKAINALSPGPQGTLIATDGSTAPTSTKHSE